MIVLKRGKSLGGGAEAAGTALWLIFSAETVAALRLTAVQAVNFVPLSLSTVVFHTRTLLGGWGGHSNLQKATYFQQR